MDKLEFKFFEKRELQKEVNLIKKQLKQNDFRVFLLTGAIVTTILLLIISL